jgi:tetratricopeptide (TPR) repeat protein
MAKKLKKARSAAAAGSTGISGAKAVEFQHATIEYPPPETPKAPVASGPERKLLGQVSFGLLVLVCAVYFRVAGFGFVSFDDPYSLYSNAHVNQGLTAEGVQWALSDYETFYWQPLTYLSHMAVTQLFGLNAGWHHVVNLLLHWANVVLLFLFLHRITGAVGRSAAAATLFAVHPLAVESVAWVTQRNTLLSALFSICAMWAYVRYVERPSFRRYSIIVAAMILAGMSKPMAVTVPVALLLLDFWPLRRMHRASIRKLIREKAVLFAIAGIMMIVTVAGNSGNMIKATELPVQIRIAASIFAYSAYLLKFIWPHPLGAFYQYTVPAPVQTTAALMALALLTLGALSLRKRAPYVLWGWAWFAIVLFPVSGVFQVGGQAIADRFTYLPFVGLYVAVIWGAAEGIRRFRMRREAVAAVCVMVTLALAAKSWVQNETWRDSVSLYSQAVKATGGNEPMHRNLAGELVSQGKITEAIQHYREAIRLDPGRAGNYFTVGHLLATQGQLAEASKELSDGLRRSPDYLPAQKELAFLYMRQNRLPEAAAVFRRVIRIAPNDPDIVPLQAMLGSIPEQPEIADAAPEPVREESVGHGPDPSMRTSVLSRSLRWAIAVVLALIALAIALPRFADRVFATAERFWMQLSRRWTLSLVAIAVVPLAIRLALLPIHPIPQPKIADEFGYLLVADTFANGRVTNPTPSMWEHFVTQYVFFQPSYTSKYPIAESAFMATAQMFGFQPWFGVWLAVGLMCMAVCWMLGGWVPPHWAVLGGLIAGLRFSITSYWMNSYWGGAVAALGGALVIGALPRIRRSARPRDGVLLAIGLLLLANTRPYEGFLLSIPVAIMMVWWLLRTRSFSPAERLKRVALPVVAVLAVGGAFMLYYNWRVTGSALVMPYMHNQKLYGTPTPFYFQAPLQEPPGLARYKDLRDNFLWQRQNYETKSPFSRYAEVTGEKLADLWEFFFQPMFTVPLLFLPLVWRRREMRPLVLSAAFVLVGIALYPFFFPHYAAPVFAIFLLIIVQGLRYIRVFEWRGRPVGMFLFRSLALLVLCTAVAEMLGPVIAQTKTIRSQALRQFEAAGGKHLVMIRYKPNHSFHFGWVNNEADIDGSQVIWARDLDAKSNQELFHHYRDRNIWLFEVDEQPARLSRYPGTERKTAGL